MATIQTLGQITSLYPAWQPGIVRSGVLLYDSFTHDYATLYRTQPNVRTCVDFLSRNIAQLGCHVFRRVSDTDRKRLADHGLAFLLAHPLPADMKVTRYRLFESLMSDLGIYFYACWLKIREGKTLTGLLRIPPPYVTAKGGLIPSGYELTIGGTTQTYEPNEVVYFHGYNPENPISGLSPLETLRRILAEEYEAGQYREYYWQNAARKEGLIKRPATAPDWSDDARERFRADFERLHSGAAQSGKVAILEEGMEWQDTSFNAQESEYMAGRKLTREECARAYHIPLPMVGILDNATFSNIEEQHKNLYQDALGPWCVQLEEDIELQLLPEFEDTTGVYVEFNIAEKLRGSFEEQTKSLQAAVGRPWMTANEARARMNLPSMPGDADTLVTPLNVLVGGQASPQDSAPKQKIQNSKSFTSEHAALRERHQAKWEYELKKYYKRQGDTIVSRVGSAIGSETGKALIGGIWVDEDRWNDELFKNLYPLNNSTAREWARLMFEQTGAEYDQEIFDIRMQPWLRKHSDMQAKYINKRMEDELEDALGQPEPRQAVKDLFDLAITVWAVSEAVTSITTAANFGSHEAANVSGLRKKRWRTNSQNPRESHQAMNGETVDIRDTFSNGLLWPGDPQGSAEDNANCQCSVDFL